MIVLLTADSDRSDRHCGGGGGRRGRHRNRLGSRRSYTAGRGRNDTNDRDNLVPTTGCNLLSI